MNQYVSLTNAKVWLEISGSSKDTLLGLLLKQATAVVNGVLDVSDMSFHKVTDERHDGIGRKIYTKDFPVVAVGTIMQDETEYTQEDAYDIQRHIIHLEDYLIGGLRTVTVDYVAGYHAKQYATITINDYTGLAGDTVTLDGTTKTEGVDFDAETSNEVTAANLAEELNTISGYEAFSLGAVVYVLDDDHDTENNSAISVSDGTNMSLSGSTLGGMDFPEDIKAAILLYAGELLNKRKSKGLQSYTIGSKTVQFSNKGVAEEFKALLKPYMRARVRVL